MNYEESLARLEAKKNDLEESSRSKEQDKKYELIKKVITGFSKSYAEEIKGDKIEQVFNGLYGFEKQKEEARSLLLVQKYFRAKGIKDPEAGKVLCFVGPPGTGKTHFASKFAEAISRKFFKINLGGASSSAIITGGIGMWRGSEEGEIIKAIVSTQSRDPVILLDEVDKTGQDFSHGSIENALLHILDPEQNKTFKDQFLGVEIDISQIIFILTANEIKDISDPLKNRLEIINLKEYNEEEKFKIAKIAIKKIFSENYQDTNKDLFEMTDEALRSLISKVKEKGVRKLERKIKEVIRRCFFKWSQSSERGEEEQKIVIDEEKLNEFLPEDLENEEEDEESELGKTIDELEEKNKKLNSEIKIMKQEIQKLQNARSNYSSVGLPWAIGGGIVLTLFGCFCGWFLTGEQKKKKKQKSRDK